VEGPQAKLSADVQVHVLAIVAKSEAAKWLAELGEEE
jgi:hypothetical protein